MYKQEINRCQPGYGSSCSLCCGSHNYVLPIEETVDVFLKRGQNCNTIFPKHQETFEYPKLIQDTLQCPNLGIKPYEDGTLGCLVYDDHNLKSNLASFFKGTCKSFHCPAWSDLSDEQIIFAARLMKDWYYYSLLINDIEAVHNLYAIYTYPEDVPDDELDIFKDELWERYIEEDGK